MSAQTSESSSDAPLTRTPVVVGNWKMFTNRTSGQKLAQGVRAGVESLASEGKKIQVGVCPPFPYLGSVASVLEDSPVEMGAQNCYPEPEGAFTGEVSPTMLADVGCRMVILGHSERRHKLGETDSFINRKVHACLTAGLRVILCFGETLADRQANRTEAVLVTQMNGSLTGVDASQMGQLILAYEPVWAIGTGHNATPEQAQEAHTFLREQLRTRFGEEVARATPIQYGGSVKPENAASLFSQPDVDGGLIGGASLQASSFLAIVQAAC